MDLVSGSRAFNRLSFQITQSMLFIIDIYDNLEDFILTLDYFDDITIFDNEEMDGCVSYYQLKTNEEVTITHIINQEWISKLYEHLKSHNNVNVSKISLISSSDIKDKQKKIVEFGEKKFCDFPQDVKKKIIKSIAIKYECNESEIDLSKFSIIKTVLTKDTHFQLAEQKLTTFLEKINPDISLRTAKLTFNSLLSCMQLKQAFELPIDASYDDIRSKKSISKKEFNEILNYSSQITIQEFEVIVKAIGSIASKGEIAIAYSNILSDIRKKDLIFFELFNSSVDILKMFNYNDKVSFGDNLREYLSIIKSKNPRNIHVISNDFYSEVIGASLLLRKE